MENQIHVLDSSMNVLIVLWGITAILALTSFILLLLGVKNLKKSVVWMKLAMCVSFLSAVIALIDYLF